MAGKRVCVAGSRSNMVCPGRSYRPLWAKCLATRILRKRIGLCKPCLRCTRSVSQTCKKHMTQNKIMKDENNHTRRIHNNDEASDIVKTKTTSKSWKEELTAKQCVERPRALFCTNPAKAHVHAASHQA